MYFFQTQLSISTKGQIEVSLQICDENNDTPQHMPQNGKSTNPFDDDSTQNDCNKNTKPKSLQVQDEIDIVALNDPEGSTKCDSNSTGISNGNKSTNGESSILNRTESTLPTRTSSRWSLDDVKKKIKGKDKQQKHKVNTFLKFNISRMRCSIKVKEEFENIAGALNIFLK